jgi:hypothetical protein
VVRWIDWLGSNYEDVTENIRRFTAMGVIIRTVINNMTFDGITTDPMQKAVRDALIGFMAAIRPGRGRRHWCTHGNGHQTARRRGVKRP